MKHKEKLHLVIELCDKHNITAYELGKIDGITTAGARKILQGITLKPRHKTLDIILRYIENTVKGSQIVGHKNYDKAQERALQIVAEREEKYNAVTNEHLLGAMDRLEKLLRPRLDMLAKAAEVTLINTDEILDMTQETKDSFQSLSKILEKKGIRFT